MNENTKKILVVEDDEGLRKCYVMVLNKNGLYSDEASTGKAAIEMCRKNNYDCVLLDGKLPDMNAAEILDRITKENQNTKAILLTGDKKIYGSINPENLAGYIPKPVKLSQLLSILKNNGIL